MSNDPNQADDKSQPAEHDADVSFGFRQLGDCRVDESDGSSLWSSFLARWLDAGDADAAFEPPSGEAAGLAIIGQSGSDSGASSAESGDG